MLFKSRFHEGIREGRITTTVRVWKRPHVKLGGRYALGDGAIVVDRMHEMRLEIGYRLSAKGEALTTSTLPGDIDA